MKVVINKFAILSKLRKKVGEVNFSFKKWGVAVHTRLEREWVSHDLKGNKVECPRKVMETQGYSCGIHTKKMETHTRGHIEHLCDIHAKKSGTVPQNKDNVWKKRKQ